MTDSLGETPQRDHDLESMKKKKLVARIMLDFMRLDSALGLDLVKSCKAGWTPLAAGVEWETMEDYLRFRRLSAGLDIYWTKTVFGLGEKLSDEEEKLIRPLVWAAEKAAMLNNDYWSWDIEYFQENQKIEKLTNAVAVLMKKEGISAQEGKDRIKGLIVEYEAEYLRLRAQFYDNHPSAHLYLQKRVELAGSMAAGVSFWSANSPRYHLPTDQTRPTGTPAEASDIKLGEIPHTSSAASIASTESEDSMEATLSSGTGLTSQSSHSDEPGKLSYFGVPKLGHAAINEPIDYVSGMPSKGVRSSLIDAMNQWCQVPSTQLAVVKRVIDHLHNSSLILDDIQDDSPMRRGKTATHLIFGDAQSINSATFLYVRVVQEVHATGNAALMTVLLEELDDLHVGQSWDLYWKYNLKWPTEDEYFSMIDLKTGGLFRMLVRMMQALSPRSSTEFVCDALVSMVSRFFQVRDDYLNLNSREYSNQKGWCEDLDEGKFSYLIIHCLENSPKFRDRIMGLFRQRTGCSGPMPSVGKVQVIEYLQESGSFDACWELLHKLEDEIEGEIKRLEAVTGEENPLMHLLLKLLSVKNEKPNKGAVIAPLGA
ncbi:geranylgeranyl pyrophosphate synthase [Colletotrichum tofieldiae]|uniref:Geranylgeranyl pyrophosphate synthase n=1 Tax=Colletotrichum tofieldiae TaxID=708197 RepID=A0A166TQD8_9PEZI|nr:geranylgeranyl pyrophosphate synthase [Colletotrichum tofieldiae]GKT87640.1 geranylgeranyl pyrophosphate synthase [Colletotrichum tofieldiae]